MPKFALLRKPACLPAEPDRKNGPLTPALSPPEGARENRRQLFCEGGITGGESVGPRPSSLFFAVALAATAILSAGCARHAAAQPPPPPSVTVAPVHQQEIVEHD